MGIDVSNIRKAFAGDAVLDDVTLSVQRGEQTIEIKVKLGKRGD